MFVLIVASIAFWVWVIEVTPWILLATLVMLVLAGVTAIWRKEHPPEMEPY
jgi:hypothetical protein